VAFGANYIVVLAVLVWCRSSGASSLSATGFEWFTYTNGTPAYFEYTLTAWVIDFSIILVVLGLTILSYAFFYFRGEPALSKFILLLTLFLFFMLLLVAASSWSLLFVAWEGVGLFSFLLVSFWYTKLSSFKAAAKVLVYSRFGDFCFVIALGLSIAQVSAESGSLSGLSSLGEPIVKPQSSGLWSAAPALMCITILTKSAQFGFHVWLLEAMEAPLPASALIHSATLVCAGMVVSFKLFPVVYGGGSSGGLLTCWCGLSSAALSLGALYNYDIKKILAYSTGSHVAIMIVAASVCGGTSGFAYMALHASTKVLIFVLFGLIIDAVGGRRDVRRMGGLGLRVDLALVAIVSSVMLSGAPVAPLSSLKDSSTAALLLGPTAAQVAGTLVLVATVLNYGYTIRVVFKVFFGDRLSHSPSYYSRLPTVGGLKYASAKYSPAAWGVGLMAILGFSVLAIDAGISECYAICSDYSFYHSISGASELDPAALRYVAYGNSTLFML